MKRAWTFITSVAATGVLLFVVLGYGGAWYFPLDLLAHFRLHLLLLALLIAVPALYQRNWSAMLRLTMAVMFAGAGLSPLWEQTPTAVAGPSFTVMNANLNGLSDQADPTRAALLAADADVLVTHETNKAVQTGLTSLAAHYPYRLSLTTSGVHLRTVIWSKFPMRDGQLLLEDLVEPTGAIATLEIAEGLEVLIVGLHLAHNTFGNQEVQIQALGKLLDGRPSPRVLVGDFNATPWSWAMQQVVETSQTRRLPGYRVTWFGTYPPPFQKFPTVLGQPIDHILASPELAFGGVETLDIPGSDHLAVKATIVLP